MLKGIKEKKEELAEKIKKINFVKAGIVGFAIFLGAWFLGFIVLTVLTNISNISKGNAFEVDFSLILHPVSLVTGIFLAVICAWVVFGKDHIKNGIFSSKKGGDIEDSVLENSRFMTEKERDSFFVSFDFDDIEKQKVDGVPLRAVLDSKGKLQVSILKGAHSLVIGSTGSGKTTTFINPMIQLLAASKCKSSMIITDPKGELFDLHSAFLKERGYDVLLLNLRDTYESSRWNPLDSIWDMYREYRECGKDIILHKDAMSEYPDVKLIGEDMPVGTTWAEWNNRGYFDLLRCQDDITVAKQKIYDEMYEDLNDLVSGVCPITNDKDPLWEKGARSIILSVCLAMLEDSDDARLNMTKEKFNFFNVTKILTNSTDNYKALKEYFEGRSQLSQAYSLSRQVLAAADQTLSSYMSITFDKLNIFNDNGICGLTSKTDIHAEQFADRPTALFLKIPDEKDTRHGLASLFILSIYKALIKVASAREDLSLPRNVYFIMDEFGNMPKIEKFDKMITVGRSRKIWFNMVVQSYSQLNNVYGETCGDIVKSNCAMKMFIGSNDLGTCKEFSELCGNKTVRTSSVSSNISSKEGDMSISSQMQSRPLIYPSELQKLNNKVSTGNAIIVTFGNYPLKTKYTPSYKCPYYKLGRMSTDDMRANVFRAEEVFYDVEARNRLIAG